MRRSLLALILAFSCAAAVVPLRANAQAAAAPTPTPAFHPVPGVKDAVTHHTLVIGGRRIAYTARAGTMLLKDANNDPTASMFYVAYTADGASARTRPVTFVWNGGPGSSTIWLHMGSFAPVRVGVPNDAAWASASSERRTSAARRGAVEPHEIGFERTPPCGRRASPP